jgi:2-polyprenyl-3-methyl-5-hydroxy-6-metoxy-1,4-benzoquinol methylase
MLAETVSRPGVRSILDVGCGGGDNLATLRREGRYDLTGIDVSVAALRRASQRVPKANLLALDAQTSELRGTFDLVMSLQVIEHLPRAGPHLRSATPFGQ